MKMLTSIRKWCLLTLLLLPLASFAQQSFQAKTDSMTREFWKKDSLRKAALKTDTQKASLSQSPLWPVCSIPKSPIGLNLHLFVQGIKFGHQHYLNFLLQGNLAKQVTISDSARLYLTLDDQSTLILNLNGRAVSRGNGMRNSSDLKFEYGLPDEDYKFMLTKKVTGLKMDYGGGTYVFTISGNGENNIQKACLLTE